MFLVLFLLIVVIDLIYIRVQYTRFNQLYTKIQGSPLQVKPFGVLLCYLIPTFMLYYYVIENKGSVYDAFLLGICVYGVYDAVTYTLLTDYPWFVALQDTLWGGILFSLATFLYLRK